MVRRGASGLWASVIVSAALAGPALAAPSSPGSWQPLSPPIVPRSSDHSATLLRDGRVLVVGGTACGAGCNFRDDGIAAAELYDPTSGRWSRTGFPALPRQYHTATLLPDGEVLVAGGYLPLQEGRPHDITASSEVYSPSTGRWRRVGSMRVGRIGHTATLLATGKVLVTGGITLKPTPTGARLPAWEDSAELFDPITQAWGDGGTMSIARAEHSATLLRDGRVLVAGGRNVVGGRPPFDVVQSLRTAELYDPATGRWTLVPHLLNSPRAAHTATLLSDGSVLLAGGAVSFDHGGTSHPTGSAELYRPASGTLAVVSPLRQPRLAHTATPLRDGRVLIVGGIRENEDVRHGVHAAASPELYDPGSRTWSPAAPDLADPTTHGARQLLEFLLGGYHTATLLPAGPVLVVGGDSRSHPAQLFDPVPAASGPASTSGAGGLVVLAAIVGAVALGAIAWRLRRR